MVPELLHVSYSEISPIGFNETYSQETSVHALFQDGGAQLLATSPCDEVVTPPSGVPTPTLRTPDLVSSISEWRQTLFGDCL